MFHHWMVASIPPLKHCSPLELIASDNTGPLLQTEKKKIIYTAYRTEVKNLSVSKKIKIDWIHIVKKNSNSKQFC